MTGRKAAPGGLPAQPRISQETGRFSRPILRACTCRTSIVPLHVTATNRAEGGDMTRLLEFIGYLIGLYMWVIIAAVILSWLIAFNVINPYNPFVRSLWQALTAVTEPLLRPIRRLLPDLGGVDISPMILLLLCLGVQHVVLGNLLDWLRRV
jgi:YggT family protein